MALTLFSATVQAQDALPTGPGTETVRPPLPERQRAAPQPPEPEPDPLTLDVQKPLPPAVQDDVDLNLRCQGLLDAATRVAALRKIVTVPLNPETAISLLQVALLKTVEQAATAEGLTPATILQRGKEAAAGALPALQAQAGKFIRMVRGRRERDIETIRMQEAVCSALVAQLMREQASPNGE